MMNSYLTIISLRLLIAIVIALVLPEIFSSDESYGSCETTNIE